MHESSVGVASDKTMMFEGDSEAMRGGARQSGCRDELGERARRLGEGG
jgi:hypothetical protein